MEKKAVEGVGLSKCSEQSLRSKEMQTRHMADVNRNIKQGTEIKREVLWKISDMAGQLVAGETHNNNVTYEAKHLGS
ncbi:hypothetical protein SUGI_0348600 [Cryptomeria japonica]|nr:hypothetical protein SUGI_0348600 [Cryptomeria japonica]